MNDESHRTANDKAPPRKAGPALRNRMIVTKKQGSDPASSPVTSLESRMPSVGKDSIDDGRQAGRPRTR